jgi:hypothetical protein
MDTPSIRGVLFQVIWEKLDDLLKADVISREEMEVRLEARDVALLDHKPDARAWYPLDCSTRMTELLVEKLSCNEETLSAESGRQATRRWLREGLFPVPVDDGTNLTEMAGEVLLMLPELLLNFGRWSFSGSSISEFQIDVLGAGAVPNHVRHAVQGGLETLIHHVTGRNIDVTSARPSFDHIEYKGEIG